MSTRTLRSSVPPRRFWPQAIVTVALLLPLTAWVGTYFWANSSPGRRAVTTWVLGRAPAGRLVLGDVRWGPRPDQVEFLDLALTDVDGRPIVRATRVEVELELPALVAGDLTAQSVRATDFDLHLAWDAEGELNLSRALAKPSGPKTATTPRRTRPLALRRIALEGGALDFQWPTWGLHFEDVRAVGAVEAGGLPLAIQADARAGASRAIWGEGRRSVAVRGVDIAGFRWAADGFDVTSLGLLGADGSAVAVAGSLELKGALGLDVEGDIALAPETAALFAGDLLPRGLRLAEATLHVAGDQVTGRAGRLEVPTVVAGPVTATDVTTPIDHFAFVPGVLKPTAALTLHDAHVTTIEAPGLVARDARLGRAAISVRAQSSATVEDLEVAQLALEDRLTTRAHGRIEAAFGLTSGTFEAAVSTDHGRLGTSGTLRISPLTKRITVTLRVALEQLSDQVARYVTSYLPAAEAGALRPPIDGFALFETSVGKERKEEDGPKRWAAHTKLREANLEGGGRVVFDGDAWATLGPAGN